MREPTRMDEPTAYVSVPTMTTGDTCLPTQDAYDAACKALAHWRAEAKRLGKIAGVKPREMATR